MAKRDELEAGLAQANRDIEEVDRMIELYQVKRRNLLMERDAYGRLLEKFDRERSKA